MLTSISLYHHLFSNLTSVCLSCLVAPSVLNPVTECNLLSVDILCTVKHLYTEHLWDPNQMFGIWGCSAKMVIIYYDIYGLGSNKVFGHEGEVRP
jgi:hypothetical protein